MKDRLAGVSGIALLEETDGNVASYEGDSPDGRPLEAESSVFDIGSVAKNFTAAAILLLQQRGELSVEDRAGDYVSLSGRLADVRIEELLTHTSGLPTYFAPDSALLSKRQALRRIATSDLGEPGEFHYSNTGYTLLASIVQSAAREPFRTFIENDLMEPAGMTSTTWYGEEVGEDVAVHGFVDGVDKGAAGSQVPGSWATLGAGGMLSTATDLLAWADALEQGQILEESAMKAMLEEREPMPGPGDASAAFGWVTGRSPEGDRVAAIGGQTDYGFTADVRLYLDDGSVTVVLANDSSFDSLRAAHAIESIGTTGCI